MQDWIFERVELFRKSFQEAHEFGVNHVKRDSIKRQTLTLIAFDRWKDTSNRRKGN